MVTKQINKCVNALCAVLVSKVVSIWKLSIVIGSQTALFSASSMCLPLVGLFGGISSASVIWAGLLMARFAWGAFSLSTLAFYVPGYCAALYLATTSRMVRCGIPLVSLVLFWMHPVGAQAALYSFYWFIPVFVGAGFAQSLYARALGATFTAHAVGSVIWLYTMPMTPASWLALIPLVALERFTFAAGLVVMYHAIFFGTARSAAWFTHTGASRASLTR